MINPAVYPIIETFFGEVTEPAPPWRGKVQSNDMAYVYILQGAKNGKYYVGSITDLERRIKERGTISGGVFSKINGPWRLIRYK